MRWWQIRKRDADLERELQADLELEEEEQLERGLSPEEARYAARRAFGNTGLIKDQTHEAWRWAPVERFLRDLRLASRMLLKSPIFAATAIITLALGIGANTAIFSVMHAVLLRMLPVRDPQQLFYLTHQHEPPNVNTTGDTRYTYGINVYERLRQDRSVFSDLIAYAPLSLRKVAVRLGGSPDEVTADEVSGNFFSAMGVGMAAGQGFAAEDEEKHSLVAVLSYGYWTRRFNRDPSVLRQTLYINGVPMIVIGVAAPHFYGIESGGRTTDIWVPLQNRPELNAWGTPAAEHTLYGTPNWWSLMLMARLRPGVSQSEALARINPLFAHAAWETAGKDVQRTNDPMELEMVPARGLGLAAEDYRRPSYVLMGMVALVLVIACVNLLMLIAARNAARQREFSMRLALGAGRWPLFRQLLAESLILTGVGATLGWSFAILATRLLAHWSGIEVTLEPDGTVLTFTLAISAAVALLFGLAPLRAAVTAPVTAALKSSSSQVTEGRGRILRRRILISTQMAVCVMLLIGAGLLVRTLRNYQHIDLGMQAEKVLAFGTHPIGSRTNAQMLEFYQKVMERVRTLPGVLGATVAEQRPGGGWMTAGLLTLDGHAYSYDDGRGLLYSNIVGPGFFETLGIPVLVGRGLTTTDMSGAPFVAVVNQTFVDRFLKGATPIGHVIGAGKWRMFIVGVVHNNKYQEAGEEPRAMAWFCYQQDPAIQSMDVEVRTAGSPMALLPDIRRIVSEIEPDAPIQNPMVLEAQFEKSYETPALFARLGAFFGGLAAVLVAIGLYGTLAYRVTTHFKEIGLRMALGATRSQVLRMVLRDSLMVTAGGLLVGLPLAWIGSKLMASMLYQMSPHDPASFFVAIGAVFVISIAAAIIPARRAASVDPMQALRSE
jgi:predicted permease